MLFLGAGSTTKSIDYHLDSSLDSDMYLKIVAKQGDKLLNFATVRVRLKSIDYFEISAGKVGQIKRRQVQIECFKLPGEHLYRVSDHARGTSKDIYRGLVERERFEPSHSKRKHG